MQFLKWIAITVVALAAVLLIGGAFLSPKFKAASTVTVNAAPDKLYALVADPRRWKEWTVWNRRDPAMEISYSGPSSGAGAGWSWKSKSEGNGSMTFTAAEPGKRLAYDLFFPDFGTTSRGDLSLAAEGTGTRVTWTMNGDMGNNLLFRWFGLFADKMVGKDFDAGLANLKALAEKP